MEQNVAAVHRLYDAFNRQDTEATRELMDPEIEWVNPEDAFSERRSVVSQST